MLQTTKFWWIVSSFYEVQVHLGEASIFALFLLCWLETSRDSNDGRKFIKRWCQKCGFDAQWELFSKYSIICMHKKEIKGTSTPLAKSYSTNTFQPYKLNDSLKPTPRPSTRPTTDHNPHDITNIELYLTTSPSIKKQIPSIVQLLKFP